MIIYNETRVGSHSQAVPVSKLATAIIPIEKQNGAWDESDVGKIGPLSFCQFFFNIFQSAGTAKNVPLASLILILKPIIIFTEQGQNEVTLKNAPGWGKGIPLDIGNLNQIGGRTEETLGRGEEGLGRGEETLGRGEEGLGRGEESLGRGEETLGRGEETLGRGEEGLGRGEETLGRGEESLGSGEETLGSSEETLGRGEETLGRGEESLGRGEETLGSSEETLGRGEETLGRGEESRGKCEDLFLKRNNKAKSKIYIKNKRRQT